MTLRVEIELNLEIDWFIAYSLFGHSKEKGLIWQ
jgi:hypothetical protein